VKNLKAVPFAAGVILLFLAWTVNQVSVPVPSVNWWDGIPIPTIQWVNPLGFLVLPLMFIGSILIVFGLTENDKLRIVLTIIIVIATYLFLRGFTFPIPWGGSL